MSLGVGFEIKNLEPLLFHSLCFVHTVQNVSSWLPAPAAMSDVCFHVPLS